MGIIAGGKRICGKTTFLIQLSCTNRIPIIVVDSIRKNIIKDKAKKMNLDIPEPITFEKKQKLIGQYPEVLVDDIEDILSKALGNKIIVASTTSHQFYSLKRLKI